MTGQESLFAEPHRFAVDPAPVRAKFAPVDPVEGSCRRAATRKDTVLVPASCGRAMHKACNCVRPAGHDGPCNCAFRDGVAPWEADRG